MEWVQLVRGTVHCGSLAFTERRDDVSERRVRVCKEERRERERDRDRKSREKNLKSGNLEARPKQAYPPDLSENSESPKTPRPSPSSDPLPLPLLSLEPGDGREGEELLLGLAECGALLGQSTVWKPWWATRVIPPDVNFPTEEDVSE